MRFLSVIAAVLLLPVTLTAQTIPLEPLPPRPSGPVQSNTPPVPPPAPQYVPIPPPAPKDPGYVEAQKLMDALQDLSQVKNPQDAQNKANDIANKIRGISLADALGAFGSVLSNPRATDLVNIANILRAYKNGDIGRALGAVYDELERNYHLPNISDDEKSRIYNQMNKIRGLLSNQSTLTAALEKLKSDLEKSLKEAGMDAAAAALSGLIDGTVGASELEGALKGKDIGKLGEILRKNQNGDCRQNSMQGVMAKIMGHGNAGGSSKMVICD